ncbi:MAG TPA: M28 family peptidase [Gemmatimonadota bacterium]|nr:M28 family peptidase [Gemmatimonadota bacterium]
MGKHVAAFTLLFVTTFPLGSAAGAQESLLPAEVKAAADGIMAELLARDLEFLSSDALLGRQTPSEGFDRAAAYIADRLERAGLTPLGDDGTYYQHYDLREQWVDTTSAYLEIDGQRFGYGEDFVLRSFAGPLSDTLRAVYVGHGWTVPKEGIDPYSGLDVRSKLVLAHGPLAQPKGVEIRRIGRISVDAHSAFVEAERRGAAAVLFIAPTETPEQWERLRRLPRRMELEPSVPSAYAAIPVTSIHLSPRATEALMAGEGLSGAEVIARGDSADYPASFELEKAVTINLPVATDVLHRPYNVVALLEGSDEALQGEVVTIASHLDGAVGLDPVDGDSIYNAADDNASGSVANLAMAEQMKQAPRPRRSIVFIWDSGEERGLWGTRHFVHEPPVPLDSIVAHVNIDMIGANRVPGSVDSVDMEVTGPNEVYLTGPGVLSAEVDSLIERVNREYLDLEFNRARDKPDHEALYPRTDAGPFLERGILTIGFFTGLHDRYHLPADEARYLDPKKIEVVARTIFASVWALANTSARPRIDKPVPATVPRYR